jgi:hypothetical protein
MCSECREKELKLQAEHQSAENQQKRVNDLINRSREVDSSIQLKGDVFNAQTVAIVELKAAIDNDASIPAEQKKFKFAEELKSRYDHLKDVIFGIREELLKKENEMRAFQVNLQHMATQLRAEERDRLKLQDVNYQPSAPKVIKPPTTKTPKAKFSKEELRAAAAKYGVPEAALQMLVVAKKMTPDEAGQHLKSAFEKRS